MFPGGSLSSLRQKWRHTLDAPALPPRTGAEKLAVGLGLFGAALGLGELLAPARMARLLGLPDSPQSHAVLRAMGLRELSSSLAILTHEKPTRWLWSRVAGDAVDLSLLLRALGSPDARSARTALAAAGVVSVGLLDLLCAEALARSESTDTQLTVLEQG